MSEYEKIIREFLDYYPNGNGDPAAHSQEIRHETVEYAQKNRDRVLKIIEAGHHLATFEELIAMISGEPFCVYAHDDGRKRNVIQCSYFHSLLFRKDIYILQEEIFGKKREIIYDPIEESAVVKDCTDISLVCIESNFSKPTGFISNLFDVVKLSHAI